MICSPVSHADITYPRDLPTIEALIDLHKKIKKDEDRAKGRILTSLGEQNLVTKGSNKFKEVRSTLDTKLNNVHSYVILATSLATTAASLYKLTMEYKDFTVNTYEYVTKKPFVAWYFANANLAIKKEIEHCVKIYGLFAASGANIWRAALDEKMMLLMTLKMTIENCRSILYNAAVYCKLMVNSDWEPDYIWEILTSDVTDEIAKKVINIWKE